MTYNLTAVDTATDLLGFMQATNDLTGKLFVTGVGVVLFFIILTLSEQRYGDMRKSLLTASFVSFILNGVFFLAGGFVGWWIVIVYVVLIVLSLILLRDRDMG
jgi:Zn-dependent protease with chaperone function